MVTIRKTAFKITFGINSKLGYPQMEDVRRRDRVSLRLDAQGGASGRLDDGRQVVMLTASN